MPLDKLQLILLKRADAKYPSIEILELENDNNNVVGIPNFTYKEVVIALKELEDNFFIKPDSVRVNDQGPFITGNVEITSIGRNYLKQN